MKTINAVAIVLLATVQMGLSQSFINLDFESARLIPTEAGGGLIDITNALPGWEVFARGIPQTQITYNSPALGSSWVSLDVTNGSQISGNYSVDLQGGFTLPAAISQTGIVPIGTESIFFQAQQWFAFSGATNLVVTLGGQNLSVSALEAGANYTLFGAAIPAELVGQLEQLEFSASPDDNYYTLDNIQFSSSPVPEPSAFYLSGLGGLFFVWRCTAGKNHRPGAARRQCRDRQRPGDGKTGIARRLTLQDFAPVLKWRNEGRGGS